MDITNTNTTTSTSSSSSWDLDMTMANPLLLVDHITPFVDFLHPMDPTTFPSHPFPPHPHFNQQYPYELPEEADADADRPEDDGYGELGAMKEMMYKIAAMQPVDIDPSTIKKPRRRNVRISEDPQSIAARHRRERISERIRILQRLVPGGTKMDTASMLDEAIRYVKFLKRQVQELQAGPPGPSGAGAFPLGEPGPAMHPELGFGFGAAGNASNSNNNL